MHVCRTCLNASRIAQPGSVYYFRACAPPLWPPPDSWQRATTRRGAREGEARGEGRRARGRERRRGGAVRGRGEQRVAEEWGKRSGGRGGNGEGSPLERGEVHAFQVGNPPATVCRPRAVPLRRSQERKCSGSPLFFFSALRMAYSYSGIGRSVFVEFSWSGMKICYKDPMKDMRRKKRRKDKQRGSCMKRG